MDMWTAIEQERRRLADDLVALRPDDWSKPTVCDAWDVKAVAAHLILPFDISKPRFLMTVIRNRRNLTKTVNQLSAKVNAANTPAEIIAKLRENASSKWQPPGAGPELPLGEIVVHAQDIRHATGNQTPVPNGIADLLLAAIDDEATRSDYAKRIGVS